MKRIKRTMLYVVLLLLGYILVVVVVNRWIPPAAIKTYDPSQKMVATTEQVQRLRVLSWNLGYAGLGAESNFVADGGEDLRPANRELVVRNADAISKQIRQEDADLIFLQEVAGASFINRSVDLRGTVLKTLNEMSSVYSADVQSWLVPYPFNMDTGKLTLTRFPTSSSKGILLPLEDTYYAGFLAREYRMVVNRLDVGQQKELVAINIHLAAFDDGATRLKQVAAVLEYAQQEFEKGNYVLVGGDWNLRLVETDFPHATDEEHLFWIADFPLDEVPAGWHLAADDQVPSVRTLHQAYVAGVNYMCTVDGFLLSPNLNCVSVENIDLGFQNSDHQPSILTLEFRPSR